MNVLFESTQQASVFLVSVPLGFFLAMFIDLNPFHSWLCFVLDLLFLVGAALSLIGLIHFFRKDTLSFYHLLALACGGILYFNGAGKVIERTKLFFRDSRKKRPNEEL